MHIQKYCLFVYGTLKKNQSAGHLLSNSEYLGKALTKPQYALYASDNYPGLIQEPDGEEIAGEVYRITDPTKELLDRYEGVPYGLFRWSSVQIKTLNFLDEHKYLESKIINSVLPVYTYIFCGNLNNFCKIKEWT